LVNATAENTFTHYNALRWLAPGWGYPSPAPCESPPRQPRSRPPLPAPATPSDGGPRHRLQCCTRPRDPSSATAKTAVDREARNRICPDRESRVRNGLAAGGEWIRTSSSADAVSSVRTLPRGWGVPKVTVKFESISKFGNPIGCGIPCMTIGSAARGCYRECRVFFSLTRARASVRLKKSKCLCHPGFSA
jgi:hypothetical protein